MKRLSMVALLGLALSGNALAQGDQFVFGCVPAHQKDPKTLYTLRIFSDQKNVGFAVFAKDPDLQLPAFPLYSKADKQGTANPDSGWIAFTNRPEGAPTTDPAQMVVIYYSKELDQKEVSIVKTFATSAKGETDVTGDYICKKLEPKK